MADAAVQTQIIKQSIAFRAKYEIIAEQYWPPFRVVTHPQNRGGDPIKQQRLRELTGKLVVDGVDPIEANMNGVCVAATGNNFQDAFVKSIEGAEDDIAATDGSAALGGSLSHSHLNCTLRNVGGGKRGCECDREPTVVGQPFVLKCKCNNEIICDEKGYYDLLRVQKHDASWELLVQRGLKWQVLSAKMDVEEPKAASIINIALNKKNEAVMVTSHQELMSAMCSLAKPDPLSGRVPSCDLIRDELVMRYGAAIDDPYLFRVYAFVLDSGGTGSVLLQDLADFCQQYVNPKTRKLQMQSYEIVGKYPTTLQRLRLGAIFWAYRQAPTRGWCPLPVNIYHRLVEGGKHSWADLMPELETALQFVRWLPVVSDTAVAGKTL